MNSGQVFRCILEEKGIKQSKIAEKLKKSQASLSQSLNRPLTFELLLELCSVIDLDFNYFLAKYLDKQKEMSSATGKKLNSSQAQSLNS